MFKCVYKADMTEQQINIQKKARLDGLILDEYIYIKYVKWMG